MRNTGKHAAGIIITDTPLEEYVPLTLQEGDVTVQYDMNAVAKLGLLKMDFLGLKTLTVIADAVENVRRTADPAFDLEQIPLDDPRTFALLNSGRTTGVFQLESGGMQALCRQLQVSNIDEIIALIALYRPGPMEWIPGLRPRQDGPEHGEVSPPAARGRVPRDLRRHGLPGAGHGGGASHRRLHPGRRRHAPPRDGQEGPGGDGAGARQVRRRREAAARHRRGHLQRDL